jgi:hypothetical protein
VYFENGVLRKKYQGRFMLILHPKKRKRLSKKGHGNTCG